MASSLALMPAAIPRRIGRPPLLRDHEAAMVVSFKISPGEYDALCQAAARRSVSVSEVIRRAVRCFNRAERLAVQRAP